MEKDEGRKGSDRQGWLVEVEVEEEVVGDRCKSWVVVVVVRGIWK